MSYQLAYSFNADPGLDPTPLYVDAAGNPGATVPNVGQFELAGWYGATLTVASGYRGFIGFFAGMTCHALFSVNPQEGENVDVPSSTLGSRGPGGVPYSVTVSDTSNNPIAGAQVWLSSDPAGAVVVAGTLVTDSTGTVTFEVPPGAYYLWRLHGKYTIPNPKTVMVT